MPYVIHVIFPEMYYLLQKHAVTGILKFHNTSLKWMLSLKLFKDTEESKKPFFSPISSNIHVAGFIYNIQ